MAICDYTNPFQALAKAGDVQTPKSSYDLPAPPPKGRAPGTAAPEVTRRERRQRAGPRSERARGAPSTSPHGTRRTLATDSATLGQSTAAPDSPQRPARARQAGTPLPAASARPFLRAWFLLIGRGHLPPPWPPCGAGSDPLTADPHLPPPAALPAFIAPSLAQRQQPPTLQTSQSLQPPRPGLIFFPSTPFPATPTPSFSYSLFCT